MELVVDKFKRDSSKGDSFKVFFEEKVTLESALEILSARYRNHTSSINFTSIIKEGSRDYGIINPNKEFIVVKKDMSDIELISHSPKEWDIYNVTENNMGFGGLEKFYKFLEKPAPSILF